MLTPEESIEELKKHLRKLQSVIENNSSFTFVDVKIVDKNRIDDVLCCIEVSFTNEYKKLLKQKDDGKFKSIAMYRHILGNIQRKFIFSSKSYCVRYKEFYSIAAVFISVLEQDYKYLYKNL